MDTPESARDCQIDFLHLRGRALRLRPELWRQVGSLDRCRQAKLDDDQPIAEDHPAPTCERPALAAATIVRASRLRALVSESIDRSHLKLPVVLIRVHRG